MKNLEEALQQGNFSLAFELCNAARKVEPQNPMYPVVSGDIHYSNGALASAEADYRAAIEMDTNYAPAYFGIGRLYQLQAANTGNRAFLLQALEYHKIALHHKADHFPALVAATEINLNRNEIGEAHTYFERLKNVNRDAFEVWFFAGIFNSRKSPVDVEAAIICFQTALQKIPNHPLALISLAGMLVRNNRLEEADQVLAQIDERHKQSQYYTIATEIADIRKDYTKALELSEKSLALTRDPMDCGNILAAMARLLDQLKQYDEAMQTMQKAKALQISVIGAERISDEMEKYKNMTKRLERVMKSDITEAVYAHYQTLPKPSQYPAFIVGFPRSGTTLLERILSAHPDVVITDEIPIFSEITNNFCVITGLKQEYPEGLLQLDEEKIEALRKAYWQYSKNLGVDCQPHKKQVHKLPLDIRNLGLAHAMFPQAKIVVPRREPRDAILSGYMQTFNFNPAMSHFYSLETIAQLYRDVFALYATYKETLPNLNTHEYHYEDLVVDPERILKNIVEFMELNWSDDLMNYRESTFKGPVSTPSYKAIQQPIYKTARERWRNYEKYLSAAIV